MFYCKVAYCRFPNSHVTKGHKCGQCGMYGHGMAECLSPRQIHNLRRFDDEVLSESQKCNVADCLYQYLHTNDAHHCPNCRIKDPHTRTNCQKKVKCPLCRTENTLKNPKPVKGLTDQCIICYEKSVEILFPDCSHICICTECFNKICD